MKPKAKAIQRSHVWVANSPSTWKRDGYTIYFGVCGYSSWRFGPISKKLGDAQTFKEAAALCESDSAKRDVK